MKSKNVEHLIVEASKKQISSDLGEEVVILNLESGVYHGLNSVGNRIWQLLQESKNVNDILNTLLEEYDVEPKQCEQDLLALLRELEKEGLVEVRNATAA